MATRVQSTGKIRVSNGPSVSGSFASLPAVGSLVLVGVQGYLSYWQAGDVTDNQGNTYTVAVAKALSSAHCAIFYTVVTASAGTFTITIDPANTGNTWIVGSAVEYSGTWNSATCLDVAQTSSSGSGTSLTTGTTLQTSRANELVAAICGITINQVSITVESVSPAWTEEHEELSWTNYVPGEFNTRLISVRVAQSCSWTDTVSTPWSGAIATFRENTPGGETLADGDLTTAFSKWLETVSVDRPPMIRDRLAVNYNLTNPDAGTVVSRFLKDRQ